MEYVYGALLLHKAGQKVTAKSMETVLEAAGVKADKGRIKALIAALKDVDIEEVLKGASMPMAVAAPAGAAAAEAKAEAKEEKKEEEKEEEEEFTAGLGSLFG
ncbi:MAG: 50S ribosomal protein P1 [Candidatus Thorarchaeota archaeon]|nr:MAG: 50S ribosomal protein P1 [Candidatus Thorarchaeota archaeon]